MISYNSEKSHTFTYNILTNINMYGVNIHCIFQHYQVQETTVDSTPEYTPNLPRAQTNGLTSVPLQVDEIGGHIENIQKTEDGFKTEFLVSMSNSNV